jgi:hypothetical protein
MLRHFQILSIHQIAKLQSILCIDCNSSTETCSGNHHLKGLFYVLHALVILKYLEFTQLLNCNQFSALIVNQVPKHSLEPSIKKGNSLRCMLWHFQILRIHQITKLLSILCIDCNSSTKTFFREILCDACFNHFQILRIHQIAKLQSILCIDCNSSTETLSGNHHLK